MPGKPHLQKPRPLLKLLPYLLKHIFMQMENAKLRLPVFVFIKTEKGS